MVLAWLDSTSPTHFLVFHQAKVVHSTWYLCHGPGQAEAILKRDMKILQTDWSEKSVTTGTTFVLLSKVFPKLS